MIEVHQEELVEKVGSVFKLVIMAARRTIELSEGAEKLVQTKDNRPSAIAFEEIRQGKVTYKIKEKQK